MNFFRRKPQARQPPQPKQLTQEELFAQLQEFQMALSIKQFENSFNKICMNKCLEFKFDTLEDSEKKCLDNCAGKQAAFLRRYKEVNS
jgi:Tim10/DDP family zinc finger.